MNAAKMINVNTTFKNTEATDSIRNYVTEKISNCLQKFVHHDTEVHVVLKVEKNRQIAECSFRTDGSDFKGSEESTNLYASIDALVDSLSNQLRKHKDKLTRHH